MPTPEDPTIKALITTYASDPAYQALINQEIGWTNVPIARNYDGDSLMGTFVNDAIYSDLNTDATPKTTSTWCSTTPVACGRTSPVRDLPVQGDLRNDVQRSSVRQRDRGGDA